MKFNIILVILLSAFFVSCITEEFIPENVYDPESEKFDSNAVLEYEDSLLPEYFTFNVTEDLIYPITEDRPVYFIAYPNGITTNQSLWASLTKTFVISNFGVDINFPLAELPESLNDEYFVIFRYDYDSNYSPDTDVNDSGDDFEYFLNRNNAPSNIGGLSSFFTISDDIYLFNEAGIIRKGEKLSVHLGNTSPFSDDDYEPNDTFNDAGNMVAGSTRSGNIIFEDIDWWTFNPTVSDYYRLLLFDRENTAPGHANDTNDLSLQTQLQLSILVYNEGSDDLSHVKSDYDTGIGLVDAYLQSNQTYYFRVQPAPGGINEGEYKINLSYSAPSNDIYEPNNNGLDAQPLLFGYDNAQVHSMAFNDDIIKLLSTEFISNIPYAFRLERVPGNFFERDLVLGLNVVNLESTTTYGYDENLLYEDFIFGQNLELTNDYLLEVTSTENSSGEYKIAWVTGPDGWDYDYGGDAFYEPGLNNTFADPGDSFDYNSQSSVFTHSIYPSNDIDFFQVYQDDDTTKTINIVVSNLPGGEDPIGVGIKYYNDSGFEMATEGFGNNYSNVILNTTINSNEFYRFSVERDYTATRPTGGYRVYVEWLD